MNLLVVCTSKSRGFTFIEFLLVLGIFTLLITVSLPLAVDFYNNQQLNLQEQGIVQALRVAQLKAMSREFDSSFGLYINSTQYVLFKGDSYLSRDTSFDEVYDFPTNLQVSGLSEVVFNKLTGTTSNTGITTLTLGNKTETININEMGRVNY